jgi:hypothetical protein
MHSSWFGEHETYTATFLKQLILLYRISYYLFVNLNCMVALGNCLNKISVFLSNRLQYDVIDHFYSPVCSVASVMCAPGLSAGTYNVSYLHK